MSSSAPTGAGRVNILYQKPMFEKYGCPFFEDYLRKKEKQCDSEAESQDDGWPGTENHWCPLLDLSYHYFIGPRLLRLMEEMDLTSVSANCQFFFLCRSCGAWDRHETRGGTSNFPIMVRRMVSYVQPFPTLQSQCRHDALRWKFLQQWRLPLLRRTSWSQTMENYVSIDDMLVDIRNQQAWAGDICVWAVFCGWQTPRRTFCAQTAGRKPQKDQRSV